MKISSSVTFCAALRMVSGEQAASTWILYESGASEASEDAKALADSSKLPCLKRARASPAGAPAGVAGGAGVGVASGGGSGVGVAVVAGGGVAVVPAVGAVGAAGGAAVGAAAGANLIALIIPCHRAIGGNGKLVNYASGVERKARLLTHEQSIGQPRCKTEVA